MPFDTLFDRRCDVIKANRALHQGQEAGIVHGPELDVLEPAKEPQIHFGVYEAVVLNQESESN